MTALAATVRDNGTAHRYELLLDSELVGELVYRKRGDVVTLIHTEVVTQLEGRGLGEQLVAGALDDIRVRGLHIVPLCPFVTAYLRRHPEADDLRES
jgi:predicted GNAT family acetyltransferase